MANSSRPSSVTTAPGPGRASSFPPRTASRPGARCARASGPGSRAATWRGIHAPAASSCSPRSLRGQIDSIADDGGPVVLVDDLEIGWDELGRLLESYEGWHLRVEVRDRSEAFD